MRVLVLLSVVLCLAGCSSLGERVSQRFVAAEFPSRVLDRAEPEVMAAAEETLEEQGYRITRKAVAQGILEAESRRLPTAQFGASEQYAINVRLLSVDPGVTRVTAQLQQQTEADFASGPSASPLRDHSRYDAFFDRLQEKLGIPVTDDE